MGVAIQTPTISSIISQILAESVNQGYIVNSGYTYAGQDSPKLYINDDLIDRRAEKANELLKEPIKELLEKNKVDSCSSSKEVTEQIFNAYLSYEKDELNKFIEMWDRINIRNIINGYDFSIPNSEHSYFNPAMTPSQIYASKKIKEIFLNMPFKDISLEPQKVSISNELSCQYYEMHIDFSIKNSTGEIIKERKRLNFHYFNDFFIDINNLIDKISEKCEEKNVDNSFCKDMRNWINELKKKIVLPAKLLMEPLTERNNKRVRAFEKRRDVIEALEYKILHLKFGEILKYTDFFEERREFLRKKYLPENFKV